MHKKRARAVFGSPGPEYFFHHVPWLHGKYETGRVGGFLKSPEVNSPVGFRSSSEADRAVVLSRFPNFPPPWLL